MEDYQSKPLICYNRISIQAVLYQHGIGPLLSATIYLALGLCRLWCATFYLGIGQTTAPKRRIITKNCKNFTKSFAVLVFRRIFAVPKDNRGVAQLVSASGLGPEGPVFESQYPDKKSS